MVHWGGGRRKCDWLKGSLQMDKETRKGNYHSISNLASQSKIMIFSASSVWCSADLYSKLEEAQDVFSTVKENVTEAKF